MGVMGCFEFLGKGKTGSAEGSTLAPKKRGSVLGEIGRRLSRNMNTSETATLTVSSGREQNRGGERRSRRHQEPSSNRKSRNRRSAKRSSTSRAKEQRTIAANPTIEEEEPTAEDVAKVEIEKGTSELSRKELDAAKESFELALSYSSPRTQHVAFLGLAKVHLARAKRLSKGSRAEDRDAALALVDRAQAITNRLKIADSAVDELAELRHELQRLPFKIAV
mmetsp:Transcript_18283/g.33810  ORF Transcript_18283/g.33810 Transcript_18283/m.33810 type:complete len:222 (-) Transcript_18283:157-822(-)|eukprot:CAMPEP_0184517380 /NCGR_PEP_ID=MMETSP0198_2-20121128/5529_1 /TAXON_ID=1112570 /ORGANISM="Thraustochytrium sp., Strain LLF1b" /LENGTH=221 /DNA_ID=CAMNT_0026907759 /DNA_START=352 /DNA_END=1017 /DNA_ORIENTATION=+